VSQVCDRCHGHGRLKVDGYTLREVAEDDENLPVDEQIRRDIARRDADPATRGHVRDTERRLADAVVDRIAGGRDAIDAVSAARERQYANGDYRELEVARAQLRRVSQDWYEAINVVYVDRDLRVVGPRLEQIADAAVVWVAARMREMVGDREIRVPSWAIDGLSPQVKRALVRARGVNGHGDLRQRNEMIRELFDSGEVDITGLVRSTGLKKSQVSEIVYGSHE
jgi:hypothetical protein